MKHQTCQNFLNHEAAVQHDPTFWPRCKGQFAIQPNGADARHQGKPYPYDQDRTACGAKLIAS